MKLTKQHFNLIARALASVQPADNGQRLVKREIANALADELQETNAHFNRDVFLSACECETIDVAWNALIVKMKTTETFMPKIYLGG